MAHIIRPNNDAPKRPKFNATHALMQQPAVKVDTNKGRIAEERKKRLEAAEKKPDQEFIELFETVKGLVVNREFWELLPDDVLQKVYAYTVFEMRKRGVVLPDLPKDEAEIPKGELKEILTVPTIDFEAAAAEIAKAAVKEKK